MQNCYETDIFTRFMVTFNRPVLSRYNNENNSECYTDNSPYYLLNNLI